MLLSGIDTLELFSRGTVVVWAKERLSEAKRVVDDAGKAIRFPVAGHPFELMPSRSRMAPFLLSSDAVTIHVNPWAGAGFPQVSCELRSAFLWQHGPRQAVHRAKELMGALTNATEADPAVTRVDLAADFQGWERTAVDERGEEHVVAGFELEDARRFVSRARRCDPHLVKAGGGLMCTGFSWGAGGNGRKKGSPIVGRLYNKTVEIRTQSPEKVWFYDLWSKSPGWREGEDVWRLEFQLRRRGWRTFKRSGNGVGAVDLSPMLKEAGVGPLDTWPDLEHAARALWKYLTGKWLKIPGPRTKSSRAALHPAWAELHDRGFAHDQQAERVWGGYAGDLTRSGRTAVLKRERRRFAGNLVREMALELLDAPDACGDELIERVTRAAEVEAEVAKGATLDELASARVEKHRDALRAILDAGRAYRTAHPDPLGLPPVPAPPEPEPADPSPEQGVLPIGWNERGTGN